jgi:hypothetical protein
MFFAFSKGRRAFTLAAMLMLMTAMAHTLGGITPITDPDLRLLITQMSGFHLPLGLNWAPSVWDIYQNLMFTMSITFAGMGLLNATLGASPDAPLGLLRRMSVVNLLWVAGFTALAAVFRITPSVISGVVVLLTLLVSLKK